MRALQNRVEGQLLHDAKRAFVRADYANAILLLHRFVRTHPHSSQSPEARWWLARSYQGSGNLPAAVKHFRLLVNARPLNPYQAEALVRATRLEDQLGKPTTGGQVNGILVSLASLRMSDDPASVIADNQTIEGDVMLLDVPCGLDGNGLRNGQPLSPRAIDSVIRYLHGRGAAVYLGVTLRCLGHVAEGQRRALEQWQDWEYLPTAGALRRSPYYSLMFEGYREFLIDWFSQLRDLPLAGLVFRSEVPLGIYEGFSPLALHAFKREFDLNFDPVQILNDDGPLSATGSNADVQRPAVLWKWAGWKARERLRTLWNLVDTLRVRLPHVQFGIEVQRQSVADPAHGLMHFAEDWADVARGPFDVFLTTIKDTSPAWPHSASRGSPEFQGFSAGGSEGWTDAVFRMVRHLGKPEKIWVVLPRQAFQSLGQSWILPDGVGHVYDHRLIP